MQGYIVNIQDLRYAQTPGPLTRVVNLFRRLFGGQPTKPSKMLGAGVRLDPNLHVVGDVYGSGPDRITFPEPEPK